jgi:alkanesulfonate monooxygenase SsuD/methylene tetrahydromethanopterin reductase-like flavin-dependent oxidoreductase (luciferase family)
LKKTAWAAVRVRSNAPATSYRRKPPAARAARARSSNEDGDDSVAVILGVEPTIRLTPQQARHFGRNLLSAAAIADDWRLDSRFGPQGRETAPRRGARLVTRRLFLLFLLFGHIDAQIVKY